MLTMAAQISSLPVHKRRRAMMAIGNAGTEAKATMPTREAGLTGVAEMITVPVPRLLTVPTTSGKAHSAAIETIGSLPRIVAAVEAAHDRRFPTTVDTGGAAPVHTTGAHLQPRPIWTFPEDMLARFRMFNYCCCRRWIGISSLGCSDHSQSVVSRLMLCSSTPGSPAIL